MILMVTIAACSKAPATYDPDTQACIDRHLADAKQAMDEAPEKMTETFKKLVVDQCKKATAPTEGAN